MVSDKKLAKYINMLKATKYGDYGPGAADWKKRKKGAYKLGELGDIRAIEPLLQYAKNSQNIIVLDALVKIGLFRNENLRTVKDALIKLLNEGPALRAQIGHYRKTYKGNIAPPDESIWLNYIKLALGSLEQGKCLYEKSLIKEKLKE